MYRGWNMEDTKPTDELVPPADAEVVHTEEKGAENEAPEKDADKIDHNPETEPTENGNSLLLQTSTESAALEPSAENDALFETSTESSAIEAGTKDDATEVATSEEPALLEATVESVTPEVPPVSEKPEELEKASESIEKAQELAEEKVVRTTRSTKRKANEIDCNDNSKDAPSHETFEQKENVVLKKNENIQHSNAQGMIRITLEIPNTARNIVIPYFTILEYSISFSSLTELRLLTDLIRFFQH